MTPAAHASPDAVYADHEALADLTVHAAVIRRVPDEGLTLQEGHLEVALDSGWMVPITAGEGPALAGFAWVGDGEVTLRLDDRADPMNAATRMAQVPGADPEALAALARGEAPLKASVSQGVFLSIDPVLTDVFHEPVLAQDTRDPLEIIVYDDPAGRRAGRRAARVFRARHALYRDLDLQAEHRVAWDLAARDHGVGPEAGTWMLVDLQTDRRFGGVSTDRMVSLGGDRWLARIRDDAAIDSRRHRARSLTMGRTDGGAARQAPLGHEVFPPSDPEDPTTAPAPTDRYEPVQAHSVVQARLSPDGLTLDVDLETRLTLRAVGEVPGWLHLQIPRTEAVPGSWALLELSAEGTSLVPQAMLQPDERARPDPLDAYERVLARAVSQEAAPPEPTAHAREPGSLAFADQPVDRMPADGELSDPFTALAVLPSPLHHGQHLELRVRTRTTWPYALRWGCIKDVADPEPATVKSSGFQDVVPQLGAGGLPEPVRLTLEVALPADEPLLVSAPGREVQRREQGQTRWSTFQTSDATAWPSLIIGRWPRVRDFPAHGGTRATEVRLDRNPSDLILTLHEEVRRASRYYEGWMPALPEERLLVAADGRCPRHFGYTIMSEVKADPRGHKESRETRYELFAQRLGCATVRRLAPEGVLTVPRFPVVRKNVVLQPPTLHNSPAQLAHQLAHQHWGHRAWPAHEEDLWIAEAVADAYACMYIGASRGVKACDERMELARRVWEQVDAARASLSAAHHFSDAEWEAIVWLYGPYVLLEMLRPRIGDGPFFLALDVLLRDHPNEPLTTERLQRYFEDASGQELSDFFDFWVHQGALPAVTLHWWIDRDGRLQGEITSDVPFGTFDVPVVVGHRHKGEVLWVEVVDGVGRFSAQRPKGLAPRVHLDPAGRILARERVVERVLEDGHR